jgi:hypothetical protein
MVRFPPNPQIELMRVPPRDQAASQHRRACDAPRIFRTRTYIRVSKYPHRVRGKRFRGMRNAPGRHRRNPIFSCTFRHRREPIEDPWEAHEVARIRSSSLTFRRDIFNASRFERIAECMAARRMRDMSTPACRFPARRHKKNPGFRRGFDHFEK